MVIAKSMTLNSRLCCNKEVCPVKNTILKIPPTMMGCLNPAQSSIYTLKIETSHADSLRHLSGWKYNLGQHLVHKSELQFLKVVIYFFKMNKPEAVIFTLRFICLKIYAETKTKCYLLFSCLQT